MGEEKLFYDMAGCDLKAKTRTAEIDEEFCESDLSCATNITYCTSINGEHAIQETNKFDFNGLALELFCQNGGCEPIEVEVACPKQRTCDDGTKITCALHATSGNQTSTQGSEADGHCECEACPTREVKFEISARISEDQFNAQKANMTAHIARLLAVRKDYVNLVLKSSRETRRNLDSWTEIYVTVKAQDET